MAPESATTRSLLIVEDDDALRGRLALAFRERGFEVHEAVDPDSAIQAASDAPPSHAIVDLRLARGSGLDAVRLLAALDSSTVIVVLTGYGSIASALEAVRLGAAHYLTKPADVDQILAAFAAPPGAAKDAPSLEAAPSLARVEWEHINRVLTDCGGNVSQAARVLGIHRRSLQRKLSKYPVGR